MDLPDQGLPDAEAMQRELAAQRKALEREFDGKLRELKAQHKRQADKLQQDRQEWESFKRAQAKELADKAEKVRRHEENARKAEGLKAEERKELEGLRGRVQELEQAKLDATAAAARSQAKVEKARHAVRSSGRLAPWLAALSVLGGLVWLATAWGAADRASAGLAGAFLLAAALLAGWQAWSMRRTRG